MCAWKKPVPWGVRIAVAGPTGRDARRWIAAHRTGSPVPAMQPSASRMNRTTGFASNARWANMRWKPTVRPKLVGKYMPAKMARSAHVVSRFQVMMAAMTTATTGMVTPSSVTTRSTTIGRPACVRATLRPPDLLFHGWCPQDRQTAGSLVNRPNVHYRVPMRPTVPAAPPRLAMPPRVARSLRQPTTR